MATATKRNIPIVRLGNSGLKVSKLILGTMQYGHKNWANWVIDDEDVAVEHIKYAYEQGITTFDTADVYSNGLSEIMLGKAIKKLNLPRDEIVILTKTYSVTARETSGPNIVATGVTDLDQAGYANRWGLSRKHIFDAIKGSLERLQVDYVDVLQCHRFDYNTPIEETMQALHDVVKAGYARYIGMSSCYAYQFQAMQNYAISHNLTPFISMQNHYNLVYREEEREMYPTLKMFGVASIPWSPIARGLLTRPLSKQSLRGSTDWFINRYHQGATDDIVNRVEEVANKKGVSMAQVATAWVLSKPGVSAPIVGTTNLEHLKDILNAVNLKLTEEEIKYLEEAYQPVKVLGHI